MQLVLWIKLAEWVDATAQTALAGTTKERWEQLGNDGAATSEQALAV